MDCDFDCWSHHQLPPSRMQVSKAHLSPTGRARSQGLEALLANPLLERFAQNLHLLVHPQTRWQGILRQLGLLASESKPPPIDKVRVCGGEGRE